MKAKFLRCVCCLFSIGAISFVVLHGPSLSAGGKSAEAADALFLVQVNASQADLQKAVQAVSEDQIIHGTFSYEKERTLYGAHAVNSAPVFGAWNEPGKAFYKVAGGILAPRFFKDSEDIGTISVRYIVQAVDTGSSSLRIDAIFVDARNVKHASKGSVEAAEYAAIQEHLRGIDSERKDTERAAQDIAKKRSEISNPGQASASSLPDLGDNWALGLTIPQLEQRVADLRRETELAVKDSGAMLKAAPFRSATTLATLPAKSEVVVVVLTPYWYGVETEDGHHGWVHRSQLEPVE